MLSFRNLNSLSKNTGLIVSEITWPWYSTFRFNFTQTSPLLSAERRRRSFYSTVSTIIIHILSKIFGMWPLGIKVAFLKNRRFAIRSFSNFIYSEVLQGDEKLPPCLKLLEKELYFSDTLRSNSYEYVDYYWKT